MSLSNTEATRIVKEITQSAQAASHALKELREAMNKLEEHYPENMVHGDKNFRVCLLALDEVDLAAFGYARQLHVYSGWGSIIEKLRERAAREEART